MYVGFQVLEQQILPVTFGLTKILVFLMLGFLNFVSLSMKMLSCGCQVLELFLLLILYLGWAGKYACVYGRTTDNELGKGIFLTFVSAIDANVDLWLSSSRTTISSYSLFMLVFMEGQPIMD